MKTIGKIISMMRDFASAKYVVTVRLEDANPDALNELMNVERLSVEIKPYRASRSLNANNYFHALCDQLARAQNPPVTSDFMKNLLISRYGQRAYKEDGTPLVIKANIPVEVMLESKEWHTWPAKGGDDDTTFYYVFRGSHTYDTKEMAVLIDGTIEDCKLYGIDTKTDREVFELLERWERDKNS